MPSSSCASVARAAARGLRCSALSVDVVETAADSPIIRSLVGAAASYKRPEDEQSRFGLHRAAPHRLTMACGVRLGAICSACDNLLVGPVVPVYLEMTVRAMPLLHTRPASLHHHTGQPNSLRSTSWPDPPQPRRSKHWRPLTVSLLPWWLAEDTAVLHHGLQLIHLEDSVADWDAVRDGSPWRDT